MSLVNPIEAFSQGLNAGQTLIGNWQAQKDRQKAQAEQKQQQAWNDDKTATAPRRKRASTRSTTPPRTCSSTSVARLKTTRQTNSPSNARSPTPDTSLPAAIPAWGTRWA